MRIGVDIDGCLADFPQAFSDLIVRVSGRDLFTPENCGKHPTCWDWYMAAGYTAEEGAAAWQHITTSQRFWQELRAFDKTVIWDLADLNNEYGDAIYFITDRPGINTKRQSELFFEQHGFPNATVLVASNKGPIINALKLDAYIDDRPDTIEKLVGECPNTKIFVKDAPYNRHVRVGKRVESVRAMLVQLAVKTEVEIGN